MSQTNKAELHGTRMSQVCNAFDHQEFVLLSESSWSTAPGGSAVRKVTSVEVKSS